MSKRLWYVFTLWLPPALTLVLALPPPALAADPDGHSATGPRRSFDWIGLELSPLALNLGNPTPAQGDRQPPTRYAVVPGITLRGLQHRWSSWYWSPLQLSGVFGGKLGGDKSIGAPTWLLALHTEAGFVRRGAGSTVLELGLAAGVGGLGIQYGDDCDAVCILGGFGAMLSPVVRLVRRGPSSGGALSAGAFVRAAVPLQTNHFGGANGGHAVLFLIGADFAFGQR